MSKKITPTFKFIRFYDYSLGRWIYNDQDNRPICSISSREHDELRYKYTCIDLSDDLMIVSSTLKQMIDKIDKKYLKG